MRKDILENGMAVELRNGTRLIVAGYYLMGFKEAIPLNDYTDNLKTKENNHHKDIVKIFRAPGCLNLMSNNDHMDTRLHWKRPEFRKIDFFEAMQLVKLGHTVYLKDDNGEFTRSLFLYEGEIIVRAKSGDNFKFSMSDTAKDWYVNEHVKMSNKIFLVDEPFSDCEDPYDTYDHIVVSANSEKEAKSIVVNTYGKDLEYYDVRELSYDKNGILFSTISNE